jgi:phosphohistidine phosphatase
MQLYLVRHAEAAPGEPDSLRPLTQAGRAQARALGERLRRDGVALDALLASPLLRARETAQAIARATDTTVEVDERLAPGATVELVVEAVEGRGERVLAVGHQPDLGRIAAALLDAPEQAFPPAGMVVVDL